MSPPIDETTAEVPEGNTVAAAAPVVNLPPFTPTDVEPWFMRVDVQFRIKKITNTCRKADYVLAALPPEIFLRLGPWLSDQGSTNLTYEAVRAIIIRKCEMSPEEKSQRLLEILRTPMGDQRPSDAINEICALSKIIKPDGTTETLDLRKVLWMARLPPDVRAHISNFSSRSIDDLGEAADAIRGTHRLTQPATAAPVCQVKDDADDDLAYAVHRRRRPPRPSYKPASKGYCYYHDQYGRDARKCRDPCSFPKNM